MKKRIVFLLIFLFSIFPFCSLADLEAHFLDVGHGDCSIVICDGEAMIIDGGVAGCSQQVFNYLQKLGITDIKYAVATHPDADHIGGLPAAFHASNVHALLTPVTEHDEKRFQTLIDTAKEKSVPVVVPEASSRYALGGAVITILSPVIKFADVNDMSIVLRIDYGETSFLFTGDASAAVERDLIARKANLNADVLKVSHHGSNTGTSTSFVNAVSPSYAIISSADRYGSPSWDVLYALADTCVLITAQKGTIIIKSDANEVSASTVPPTPDQEQADHYVGNSNSKIYHRSSCTSAVTMKDKNKVYFETTEQAEGKGYRPCKNCSP